MGDYLVVSHGEADCYRRREGCVRYNYSLVDTGSKVSKLIAKPY